MDIDAYLVLGATISCQDDTNYEVIESLDVNTQLDDGLSEFLEELVYDLTTELGFEVTYSLPGHSEHTEEFVIHGMNYHNAEWHSAKVTYPYFTEQDYIQHGALIQALKKKGFKLKIMGVILFAQFSF